MKALEKLEEITDLREIWPHEALDFTPWLAEEENLALLCDAVGLDITVNETESSVGDFSVDIFASEMGTDRKIIIENQLEDTDHDHLGKLITYASGKDADVVIWIVKRAREEHKAAVEWLNNHTDDKIGFFLCEIKLYRIGDSAPAIKFEVAERPNDWAKELKKNASVSATEQFRYDYWTAFNRYAYQNPGFAKNFKQRKATMDHWMDLSIGTSACHIGISLIQKRNALVVELYINERKKLFYDLFKYRKQIEDETDLHFDWRELPDKKASRILLERPADLNDQDDWTAQFDWIMETALKMKTVFRKYMALVS